MVGDGLVYAAQHKARHSTEDAGRKAKAAEELKNQQEAAEATRTVLAELTPKLAKNPKLLINIVNLANEQTVTNALGVASNADLSDINLAKSLYDSLKKAKVELKIEQVVPYLLNNGLLEALSKVSKEEAKAIFAEVIELPFIKSKEFTETEDRNFAATFDKAMDIVEVFEEDQQTLAQLGSIVAKIVFPTTQGTEGEIESARLKNNRIYLALRTVLPTLAAQPLSALVTQLAKTVDEYQPKSKTTEELEKNQKATQKAIENIDRCLKSGVKLEAYSEWQKKRKEIKELEKAILSPALSGTELAKKVEELAKLKEQFKKLESKSKLSASNREALKNERKRLENSVTPLDRPRLIISETLGLKPRELTTLARFAEQPIKDLLNEKPTPKLAEELVGIINVAKTERAAKFMELAPRIVRNHSASITRFLGNNEVKGIIRNNTFLQRQIAAQGFAGQEQRVINLALDSVYPSLIGPAMKNGSLVTLLDKTLAPETSTADQANAAIDFVSINRTNILTVIDVVASDVGLVQAALARAGIAEGEDLAKLAPQVSSVIRENKQGLLDLTSALAAMDPGLRKLILEEVLPAKAQEAEGRIVEKGASPTQDTFSEEEIVKREGLIKVYRQLTGKPEDHEIPAEFTTEMLETTIRGILKAQNEMNESAESSRAGSISSEEDRSLSQAGGRSSSRSSSVEPLVEGRERSNSAALRIQESSTDVISPLHETVASPAEVSPPKKPALASFLDEYQPHIPKILSSATPLVKALSNQNEATRSLVQDISNLMKAKEERALLEASTNINQKTKEEVEAKEKGLLSSVITKGLQIAKNPEVIEATKHAISENRDLLAKIIDKKLVELAKGSKYEKYIKMINGKFVVKAMEHANNKKSLEALEAIEKEAIEKFVSNPSISEGIYLAWKTNNIKLAIGAAAGYFKQKEESKQQESPEKSVEAKRRVLEDATKTPVHHSRLPRVSSKRSSSISRV